MSKKYYERLARGSATSSKEFKSDFGLKILKSFGWEEGKGLGADLEGRTDCIQVTRREERVGLGGEKTEKKEGAENWNNWWVDAYNGVAAKSSPGGKKKDKKNKNKNDVSKSDDSDSDSDSDSSSSEDDDSDKKNNIIDSNANKNAIKGARVMGGKLARIVRMEQGAAQPKASAGTTTPTAATDSDSIMSCLNLIEKFREEQIKVLTEKLDKLMQERKDEEKKQSELLASSKKEKKSSKSKKRSNDDDEDTVAAEPAKKKKKKDKKNKGE